AHARVAALENDARIHPEKHRDEDQDDRAEAATDGHAAHAHPSAILDVVAASTHLPAHGSRLLPAGIRPAGIRPPGLRAPRDPAPASGSGSNPPANPTRTRSRGARQAAAAHTLSPSLEARTWPLTQA